MGEGVGRASKSREKSARVCLLVWGEEEQPITAELLKVEVHEGKVAVNFLYVELVSVGDAPLEVTDFVLELLLKLMSTKRAAGEEGLSVPGQG